MARSVKVIGHLKVKSRSEANFFITVDRDMGFSFSGPVMKIPIKVKVISRSNQGHNANFFITEDRDMRFFSLSE